MAWDASNLHLQNAGVSGGPNLFVYRDTVVHTDADAAGYFATGVTYGMKVGDIVLYQETDNSYATTTHSVISVSGTAATIGVAILA